MSAPRTKKGGKGEESKSLPSRWEDFEAKGEDLSFPPLEWDDSAWGDRVAGWLLEVGPVHHGGMGIVGLPWAELAHWSDMTCITPDPWEYEALFKLSGVYASWLRKAEEPSVDSPWEDMAGKRPNRPTAKAFAQMARMMQGG